MKFGVFVVDPDRSWVEDFRRRMLIESIMEVRDAAAGGMEAFNKVQQFPPDVLVVSTALSDVGAVPFVQNLKMMHPGLRVVVVSHDGQADPVWQTLGVTVLPKHYGTEGIVDRLRQLLSSPPGMTGTSGAIPPWGYQQEQAPTQQQLPVQPVQPVQPFQSQQSPAQSAEQTPWQQQAQGGGEMPWQQQLGQTPPAQQPQQGQQGPFGAPQAGIGGAQAPWPQGNPAQANQGWGNLEMNMDALMGGGNPSAGGYRTIRQTLLATHSPKGGVGKSSISKELAVLFSRAELNGKPLRVLLVDCDLDFGDVGALFRVEAQFPNVAMWAQDVQQRLRFDPSGQSIRYTEEQIRKFLIPSPRNKNIQLLLAPPNHADALDITGKQFEIILDNIRNSDMFDIVILDTGPNTKDYTLVALDKANIILYITNQEYTAINDCYLEIKTLRSIQFPVNKMHMIVNQAKSMPGLHTPEEISHALGIQLIGTLPDVGSQKMASINNKGEALSTKDNDTFTQSLRRIAHQIVPVFQRKVQGGGKGAPPAGPRGGGEEKPKKRFSLFGRK